MTMSAMASQDGAASAQYVTVRIGGQLFGLPILAVHEVFLADRVTPVQLAPEEVEGVLNLRGRIVTTINMRRLLGFPPQENARETMAVGVDYKGESYGLIIDTVGEVLSLEAAMRQPNPANLDRRWAEISAGVHRLAGELMIILDVERVLGSRAQPQAA